MIIDDMEILMETDCEKEALAMELFAQKSLGYNGHCKQGYLTGRKKGLH